MGSSRDQSREICSGKSRRKKQERNEKRRKKEKMIKIKKVAKEWEIWNEKEEAVKLEEEAKKLVS